MSLDDNTPQTPEALPFEPPTASPLSPGIPPATPAQSTPPTVSRAPSTIPPLQTPTQQTPGSQLPAAPAPPASPATPTGPLQGSTVPHPRADSGEPTISTPTEAPLASSAPQASPVTGVQQPTPLGAQGQTSASPTYVAPPFPDPHAPTQPSAPGQPGFGYAFPQPPTADAPTPKRRRGFLVPLLTILAATIFIVGAGLLAWTYRGAFMPRQDGPIVPPSATADAPPSIPEIPDGTPNWEGVSAAVGPAVVTINVSNGNSGGVGSGVIYTTDGLIITNHHVINDAQGEGGKIHVTLPDQRMYAAQIVGTDPSSDLAVIRLENPPSDLQAASFGTSSSLKVGQPVMAIGAPLGLSNTVTTGIISALDRPVAVEAERKADPEDPFGQFDSQTPSAETIITNAIQVDASINPGNSGGPLFNRDGQVIGINSSIASIAARGADSAGSIGLGFAIPVDLVRSVADQLITNGKVDHAILGVTISTVALNIDGTGHLGALINEVVPGGAADQAGVHQEDLITHVNGKRTPSSKALQGAIRAFTAGTEVTLTVVRDGKPIDLKVTLQSRP